MKTQKKGLRLLKNLFLISTVFVLAISCGKDNTSGNSNSTTSGSTDVFGNYGQVGGLSSSQLLNTISQENPCIGSGQFGSQQISGTQRVKSQITLSSVSSNIGTISMGVSSYGDIAIIQNQNGQVVADLYLCPRVSMTSTVNQISNIVINHDSICPVSKIDSAYFEIQSQSGFAYRFGVAPIHIPGTNRQSSLCQ